MWKGLLSLDWGVPHLRCLFTPLFTHCHPQLIPHGDWAACPLQGPQTHPGHLWMPNWAYRSPDWINSSVSGTFSPSTEEGDYSTPAWDPCTVPQKTEQREREEGGWRKQRVRGGSCWNCPENVSLSVGKPRLEMWTGGNERSQSSQDQWAPAGQRVKRTYTTSAYSTTSAYVLLLTFSQSVTLCLIVVIVLFVAQIIIIRVRHVVLNDNPVTPLWQAIISWEVSWKKMCNLGAIIQRISSISISNI